MSKPQPEHGPRVTAFLKKNPLVRDLLAGYEGMAVPYARNGMHGRKFSPEAARAVVDYIFATDSANLSINGVETWADFYWYIHHRVNFHVNYIDPGMIHDIENYRKARNEDEMEAMRKERNSRRKK